MAFSYLVVGSQFDMLFKIVKYIDIVSHRTSLFLEIETQKKVPKILANTLSDNMPKKQRVPILRVTAQNSFEFLFPFPQSSQKKELVIPRFTFPQDLRE